MKYFLILFLICGALLVHGMEQNFIKTIESSATFKQSKNTSNQSTFERQKQISNSFTEFVELADFENEKNVNTKCTTTGNNNQFSKWFVVYVPINIYNSKTLNNHTSVVFRAQNNLYLMYDVFII